MKKIEKNIFIRIGNNVEVWYRCKGMDNIIFPSFFFKITILGYYQPVSSVYPIDHKMGENFRVFFFFRKEF